MQDQLRRLPQIQTILETDAAVRLIELFGRADVTDAVRLQLNLARQSILNNAALSDEPIVDENFFKGIADRLNELRETTLRAVINATGIIISTNLGRARLALEATEAMQAVASNYSTLELDLDTGKRGTRQAHVEALICQLTGAEAALVLNNCAAAVLTSLSALAAGKEVVASRGELVEIGGSFRMPDVIARSGAILKEVGSTNRTRLKDFEHAIGENTALLLKSHTSNFRVVGFTAAARREELAHLAQTADIPLVEDLGSGLLVDLAHCNLPDEPIVRDVLDAGVDLVMFSGDKLLGGPQAGIVAGKRALVAKIGANPIARACRIDKLSLAALHATLGLYLAPNNPFDRIPVLQALSEPIDAIRSRADRLMKLIADKGGLHAEVVGSIALAGGGTLPGQDLPSFALALTTSTEPVHHFARRLRQSETAIIGRIVDDRLQLDMRTVLDHEIALVADAIARITQDHAAP